MTGGELCIVGSYPLALAHGSIRKQKGVSSLMNTKIKLIVPILLGAVTTVVTPIIFCTIIGRVMGIGGQAEVPSDFTLLALGIWTLLNILSYLASLLLFRKLGLPLTSFRLIAHGVMAMLVLLTAPGVLPRLGDLNNAASIPGLLLLFATAFAAFLLSTLLQFLSQTIITRFSWR
jgi:hypothetical protein